jgi:hypothetical protein
MAAPKVLDMSFLDIEVSGEHCDSFVCFACFLQNINFLTSKVHSQYFTHTNKIMELKTSKELSSQTTMEEGENGSLQPKLTPASALRLSSNNISDISQLWVEASKIVKEPVDLRWVDLSCNSITEIPPEVYPCKC